MMHQGTLQFGREAREDLSIAERFREFDAANPDVYSLFRRLARKLRKAGHWRFSADAILHQMRWRHAMAGAAVGSFKLNNIWAALYARKLAAEAPSEFGTFFEFRRRAEEKTA